MEDDKETYWTTIESRRNVLLSKTDWTQLPDAGLTRRCVVEWRKWRHEMRAVNAEVFSDAMDATKEIRRLRDNKPTIERSDDESVAWEEDGHTVDRTDLKRIIEEVFEEIKMEYKPKLEPTTDDYFSNLTDIIVARQIARKLVRERYNKVLGNVSPTAQAQAMYNERLSQAIDLLSETSDAVPLLEVMATVLEKTAAEVAESVIDKHRQMINDFCGVEAGYLRTLKKIQEADTIEELKEIVIEYGH